MRFWLLAFVVVSSSCDLLISRFPDGGGFGQPPPARVVVDLAVIGADGVALPLERDLGHPLAAGVVDGAPVVISAEIVDALYTGALLVFVDPLRAAPPALRIDDDLGDGVSASMRTRYRAVFGDLDEDGDDDVVVAGAGTVIGLVGGPGGLTALPFVRLSVPVEGGGALGDIDGDGDGEAVFADGGFDRDGIVVDIADGSLTVAPHSLTHFVVEGEDHCISSWHNVNGGLWALGGACGTDDDPTPSPMRVFAFTGPGEFVSSSLRDTNANGVFSVVPGRGVDSVDLFVNAFFQDHSPARPPVNLALRKTNDAIDVEVRAVDVDAVADLDGGGPAIVDVFDEPDDDNDRIQSAFVIDEGDAERVLVVVVSEEDGAT